MAQHETAVQELTQNYYYHTQIKVVRGQQGPAEQDQPPLAVGQTWLQARFLEELKSDHHAAYKSYTAANQLLLDRGAYFAKPQIST